MRLVMRGVVEDEVCMVGRMMESEKSVDCGGAESRREMRFAFAFATADGWSEKELSPLLLSYFGVVARATRMGLGQQLLSGEGVASWRIIEGTYRDEVMLAATDRWWRVMTCPIGQWLWGSKPAHPTPNDSKTTPGTTI